MKKILISLLLIGIVLISGCVKEKCSEYDTCTYLEKRIHIPPNYTEDVLEFIFDLGGGTDKEVNIVLIEDSNVTEPIFYPIEENTFYCMEPIREKICWNEWI